MGKRVDKSNHMNGERMASSLEFVEYVCDQLAPAGEVTYKRMFGEFGLYCDGKYFAGVCDDRFLVKVTEEGKAFLKEYELQEPYEGAKPAFYIENLDDRDNISELVRITCAALPAPKPRKKKVT